MQINFVKKGQMLLLLSFAVLVLVGALLLMLPGVYRGELKFIDAIFMACSSVCLCGLSTVNVTDFSFGGQILLVLFIQIGCLGIMTLTAMLLLVLGKGLSFSNTLMMSNLNDRFTLRGAEMLIRTMVHYTLITEACGAILMFPGLLFQGFGFFPSLWYAIFLSVSSFCNAGISPVAGSMVNVGGFVQAISIGLMIMGGLGVYVVYDIIQNLQHRSFRLRLHSRIVLITTVVLLAGGTFLLWMLSRADAESVQLSWYEALFMSASSRTTGLMTVDPGTLTPACQMLLIFLMLIGGSPGSAAGGMKTTTFAVVCAALATSFKGEKEVLMGKRTIPVDNVLRAFTIMVLFILIVCGGALLLNSFSPEIEAVKCYFESASALSATGLSTGATTTLWDVWGKLLLIVFMFAGRVGPLTIILFFSVREKHYKLRYPEEQVIVG